MPRQKTAGRRPTRPALAAVAGLVGLAAAAAAQAPGQFAIDPEAAERALERALVQTGSVLLPPRSAEVAPFLSFVRRESEIAGLPVIDEETGNIVGSSIKLERNEANAGLTFRTGLPWDGQIDLTVPFAYVDREQEQQVLGATIARASDSTTGIGDVRLTYAKTLRAESARLPSFIGSVSWDSDTGEQRDSLFLGSGFHEVGVALTATQRQDPLVFSGRVGYQYAFEKDDVRPGEEISLAAGAFLAVSPETSLQFGFSLARTADVRLNDEDVAGSDQLAASLNLGLATILRRNVLLDGALSVGLTEDAPDFGLAVNMPLRFSF